MMIRKRIPKEIFKRNSSQMLSGKCGIEFQSASAHPFLSSSKHRHPHSNLLAFPNKGISGSCISIDKDFKQLDIKVAKALILYNLKKAPTWNRDFCIWLHKGPRMVRKLHQLNSHVCETTRKSLCQHER